MSIDTQLFLNKLQKAMSNKFERKFSSHIIKIAQEENNGDTTDAMRKIRNAVADLGVTTAHHPLLVNIFEKIISHYALDAFQQSANPSMDEAVNTAIQKLQNEASQYKEQLNYLLQQKNYVPPTDKDFSSLSDFMNDISSEYLPASQQPEKTENSEDEDTVQIRARYMPRLEEKIEKLKKVAEKIGAPPPSLEIISEDMIVDEDTGVAEKWYTVKIHGDTPQINGWRLIAKLEHSPTERNIVYAPTYEGDIPEEYYTIDNNCEHCGYNRNRKYTYLLQNVNTGIIKQVGSTCLQDFTGHPNPEVAAAYFERLSAIDPETIKDENKETAYSGEHKSYYFDPVEFLSHVAAMIREQGWVSKTQARNSNWTQPATASEAINNMFPYKQKYAIEPTDADRELAKKALEWIRNKGEDFYNRNDYLNNLWVVSQDNQPVSYRHTGLLASLISTYQKAMDEQKKQKQTQGQMDFVGKEHERRPFTLTVERVLEFPSHYGPGVSYMHQMKDENGNVIIWWTSSAKLEEGETYQMDATIKEHKYYKGVPQTVITNPRGREQI